MAAEKSSESKAAAKKGGDLLVTAPLVAVRDENGNTSQLFNGDVVPEGTSQKSIDHLRDLGYIAESK